MYRAGVRRDHSRRRCAEAPHTGSSGAGVLRGPCGHCFDIARSGYINLLQPQDKRSRDPGDAAEAIAARRRLLDAGTGTALLEALYALIAGFGLPPRARALDIGSGEGSLLGALAARFDLEAAGVDLSARAVELAARRHPGVLWLVANADRGLPFADGSLDLVLSITARRSPAECARVLAPGGRLVVAVPAPDDLVGVARGGPRQRIPRGSAGETPRGARRALQARSVAARPGSAGPFRQLNSRTCWSPPTAAAGPGGGSARAGSTASMSR